MRRLLSCLAVMTMFCGPVHAQSDQSAVALDTRVFVERGDRSLRTVEVADRLRRGDRVVTILRWDAPSAGTYTVTSPVPERLAFEGSPARNLEISTDGGRTWKRIKPTQPGDVTHLRWQVSERSGRLAYSAIVR